MEKELDSFEEEEDEEGPLKYNLLENIVENFDDVNEIPPSYFEVSPSQDTWIYDKTLKVNIEINKNLNDKESLLKLLNKTKMRNEIIGMMGKQGLTLRDSILAFNTQVKVVDPKKNKKNENNNDGETNEISKSSIEELLKKSEENIKLLHDEFYKMDQQLKYILNQFDVYIKVNLCSI